MIEASKSGRTIYHLPVLSVRAIKFVLSLIVVVMSVGAYFTRPGSSAAPVSSREKVRRGAEFAAKPDGILREVESDGFSHSGANQPEAVLGALRFFLPFPEPLIKGLLAYLRKI